MILKSPLSIKQGYIDAALACTEAVMSGAEMFCSALTPKSATV